eukprot:gene5865-6158_t
MVLDSDNAGKGPSVVTSARPAPPFYSSSRDLSNSMSSSNSLFAFRDLNQSFDPSLSLTERAKILQSTAANALTLYARDNPGVQRLVEAHHNWETNLRDESQRRLGNFQPEPFLRQSGLIDEDFSKLKRTHRPHSSALVSTAGMKKKSLSMSSFDSYSGSQHAEPRTSAGGEEEAIASNLGMVETYTPPSSFDPISGNRRFAIHSAKHSPKDRGVLTQEPANAGHSPPPPNSNVSLEDLSIAINAKAQQRLEELISSMHHNSHKALLQARSNIKKTASNLEGNLHQLSSIFSPLTAIGGVASSTRAGPKRGGRISWPGTSYKTSQPATSTASQPVTPTDSQPLTSTTGAIVPLGMLPKRLREGEESRIIALDKAASGEGDWVDKFEKYVQQMGQKQKVQMGHSRKTTGSVRDPGRQVAIVTTAALPWMTGTSINPLLRAAYMAKDDQRKVTLVIPWLSKIDQDRVFPSNTSFETPEQQEVFVREWARKRTGLDCFVMPVGDITQSIPDGKADIAVLEEPELDPDPIPDPDPDLNVPQVSSCLSATSHNASLTCIPDGEADIAVLEEPEHLTWYHHGKRWSKKFNKVVGVMHTNYLDYIRREPGGAVNAFMMEHFNRYVCGVHCDKVIKLHFNRYVCGVHCDKVIKLHFNRYVCGVHCDKVIKLSDAVQSLPRQQTMFVHGVSPSFLQVGAAKSGLMIENGSGQVKPAPDVDPKDRDPSPNPKGSSPLKKAKSGTNSNTMRQRGSEDSGGGVSSSGGGFSSGTGVSSSQGGVSSSGEISDADEPPRFQKGAYFVGKALWAKGYTELIQLMKEHSDRTGENTPLDVFGHGPDFNEIQGKSKESRLAFSFNGPADHAAAQMHDYKLFINPSLSDVVATTTAEALAMGKFVLCAKHPSNKFFERYPNCLLYSSSEEFTQQLNKAMSSEPKPLSANDLHSLSWEAATDRFMDAADVNVKPHFDRKL